MDFDSVRAKLDGRKVEGLEHAATALFPNRFQDSPLGPIPQGWRIEKLGDHVELQRGTTYKSKLKNLPGPYLLGLASIGRNGGFRADKLSTYGGDCPEKLLVYPGDLFVSLKDVTQSADLLGSVARMPLYFSVGRLTQDTVKLCFKQGAPSKNIVYRTLLTEEYRAHCRSHATGTTNLGLAREDFLSYPLIVPPPEVESAFDRIVDGIEAEIGTNERQSRTLASLRDALLPKLPKRRSTRGGKDGSLQMSSIEPNTGLVASPKVYVFICSSESYIGCIEKSVFGSDLPWPMQIVEGDYAFYTTTRLGLSSDFGRPSSNGGRNLVPKAWGKKFPYQVKVALASSKVIEVPKELMTEFKVNASVGRFDSLVESHLGAKIIETMKST